MKNIKKNKWFYPRYKGVFANVDILKINAEWNLRLRRAGGTRICGSGIIFV